MILLINVELDPQRFLLGLYSSGHKMKRTEQRLLEYSLLQEKGAIACFIMVKGRQTEYRSVTQGAKYVPLPSFGKKNDLRSKEAIKVGVRTVYSVCYCQ